jgi:hypothetical protein
MDPVNTLLLVRANIAQIYGTQKLTRTIRQAIDNQHITKWGRGLHIDSYSITLDWFGPLWIQSGPKLVPKQILECGLCETVVAIASPPGDGSGSH